MDQHPDEIAELRRAIELLHDELAELRERIPPLYTGSISPAPAVEVDAGQAAAVLGIGRRYFVDELSKKPGFPKPTTNLSNKTRRWRYADILRVKVKMR